MSKSFLLDLIIEILMKDFDIVHDAISKSEHPKAASVLDKLDIVKEMYELYKAKKQGR